MTVYVASPDGRVIGVFATMREARQRASETGGHIVVPARGESKAPEAWGCTKPKEPADG